MRICDTICQLTKAEAKRLNMSNKLNKQLAVAVGAGLYFDKKQIAFGAAAMLAGRKVADLAGLNKQSALTPSNVLLREMKKEN
jgi:hypothetical protein